MCAFSVKCMEKWTEHGILVWNERNSNFSFLSVEKYKKIFNIGFIFVEITHFTFFKIFFQI